MGSCGTPVITSVHSDIINKQILTKLDGPTLASTSCVSSELHTLCSEESLWKNICDSAWPSTTDPRVQDIILSFPGGHRSFFANSFPSWSLESNSNHLSLSRWNKKIGSSGIKLELELISAVDVHIGDKLIYSKVLVKEDMPGLYTNSFLRLDLMEVNETVTFPMIKVNQQEEEGDQCIKFLREKMKLSWIMIDPIRKRGVNLSSHTPVEVRWNCWMSKDYIQVHYGTVMAAPARGPKGGFARFEVTVTCERKKLEQEEFDVIQVRMEVEDVEGKMVSGKDSLAILHEAMDRKEGKRGN